ncbi:MAG TPA: ABC transporter permease [Alphaproteobacteria bacterium]|nr:ABC transporter permease [Alphaproteobacteria bacterium]
MTGMSYAESVRSALTALRANPLRSALTMLGIFIGVAAVIAMVAIGAGARAMVLEQIRSLGSNIMIVMPGNVTAGGVRLGAGASARLTLDDAAALEQEIPAVQIAASIVRGSQQVVAGNLNWSTVVQGVVPGFFEAREWDVSSGRLFLPEEIDRRAQVALLGQTVARTLFDESDPVGQSIRIRNVPFTIIGVLAPKGQTTFGQDQDDIVMLPFGTARHRIFGVNRANARNVGTIVIKIREGDDMAQAEDDMRALLRQRHRLQANQDDDFIIRNLTEIAATRDASSRTLALLLAAVAAVSLAVGGIGIMNIMLVSVTERTREIGVRLAVGARPRDIRSQFLIEATTLSVLGGAAGAVLGIGAAVAIASVAGWPTLVQPGSVALAIGFSGLVGIFFGFYPAQRAARLDPIEALRHE